MMERMMKLPLYQKKDGKYNNSLITKLVENFRTHPALLLFSNHHFYENDLIAQNLMGNIRFHNKKSKNQLNHFALNLLQE